MTKDDCQSLVLRRVTELDAQVDAFGECMAEGMRELKAAVSRLEIEVEGAQAEIAKMNRMIAARRRVLADRAADRSIVPSLGHTPAAPYPTE